MAYYGGLIMKGIVLGTTAGALIGVMISVIVPQSNKKLKNKIGKNTIKFIKKGRKTKYQIMKKIAKIMYEVA